MKRSIYIVFPILALVGILISGFGILPKSTQQLASATPMPTLIARLGTPVQTPQSNIFESCPSGGEGRVVTNFAKDLKGIPKIDYAENLSPESLARYVATLSKDERVAYLKTLKPEQMVKYAAGLSTQDRKSYLETLTSTARARFEADLAEYQQGELYQNELKNRTDRGDYKSMKFQDLLNLPPTAADIRSQLASNSHWKNRGNWETWQKALVYRYEGLAIKVDGYLFYSRPSKDPATKKAIAAVVGAQEMDAESTNCFFTTPNMVDWHLTLTGNSKEPNRSNAIVVEVTPRVRASYSKGNSTWTIEMLTVIAKNQYRVRISGWLFFDPEHPANLPDPLKKYEGTRGTLWEIHPIMRIFVKLIDNDSSPWYALETCNIDSTKTILTCKTPDPSEKP